MAAQQLSWVLTAQDATASAFASVDRRLLALSGRVSGVGSAFKVMSVLAVASFAAVVSATAEFDKWMRNVNSISHMSEAALNSLGEQVLALARDLPLKGAAVDLARGLYDIASSGFYGAEGLQILGESARAASAGLTTTQNSAKAIVGVLNAYGLEASDAADVSDALFQTVNLGIITFEELSQQLGDVIGLSAAAGVEIDEVGAAIAAITLAGIPAAEAFTSLNQLFRKLLDPSKSLSAVYSELGIVIGRDLKDPAIGLEGVMRMLTDATGGSVEAFIQLFPEIRAARGAFALMANDGQNFARTMEGIADETNRAGATQKALDEQMKSLSAQWRILINHISVGAIELGSRWLPALVNTVNWIDDAIVGFGRLAQEGYAHLQPFFAGLGDIFSSLGSAIEKVWERLGPVAVGFAAIGAAVAILGLNVLIQPFVALAEILDRYPQILAVVATAFGVQLTAAILAASRAAAVWLGGQIHNALWNIANVVVTAAQNFMMLSTVMKGITLAGIIGGVILLAQAFQGASDDGQKLFDTLTQGFDNTTVEGLNDSLRNVSTEILRIEENLDKTKGGLFSIFDSKKSRETLDQLDFLKVKQGELARSSMYLAENTNAVAKATGLTTDQVKELAKRLGVDLTGSFKASEDDRQKLEKHMGDITTAALGAGRGLKDLGQTMPEEMERMAKAANDFITKVSETFMNDTNLVTGFAEASKEHGDAMKDLADAQSKFAKETSDLADVRARMAADTNISITDNQSLANALEAVGEASNEVTEAQKRVNETNMEGFFKRQLEEAKTFAEGIRQVAADGLNPQLVAQLLEAGPKAAAPMLQALTSDHGTALIGIANETQKTLGTINNQVVEAARVTHLAITTKSSAMAADFDIAMQILALKAANGGKITVDEIVAKLGILPSRAREITTDYVIVVEGKLGEAKTAGSRITSEMADEMGRQWARAEGDAAAAASAMNIRTGIDVNAMAANTISKTGNMADEMIGNVNRGANETERRLRDWSTNTRSELNTIISDFISPEALASAQQDTGNIFTRAMGGYLPRDATFQPEGTKVQWAEPGTGGEWFFPDAYNRRRPDLAAEMLDRWGYAVVPKKEKYDWGGQRDELGLPVPPEYRPWWTWPTATSITDSVYQATRTNTLAVQEAARARAALAAASGAGGLAASADGLNPDFLDRFNRWNDSLGGILTITSGFRSRAQQQYLYDLYLSGKGNLAAPPGSSMHEKGLAIDHSPHWEGMDATANKFGLHHPVYSPQRETWHVEPFDNGGWLQPGWTLAWNGTGRPELVTAMANGGYYGGYTEDDINRMTHDERASISASQPHGSQNISASGGYKWANHSAAGWGYYTDAELGYIHEDDPRWDWRTMGNQTRGVVQDGSYYWQHADGSLEYKPDMQYMMHSPNVEDLTPSGNQSDLDEYFANVKRAVKEALEEAEFDLGEIPFVLEMDGDRVTSSVSRRMHKRGKGRNRG